MTTVFNLEYTISIVFALGSAFGINHYNVDTNPIIKFFVVPLLVAYTYLLVANKLLPQMNEFGDKVGAYVETKTLGEINSLGYMQIFPPVFAVFLIFIILIFNKNI
tara:strand:- start:4274 stop:4591 length:318 start_codon:yes stop_codon:yes gene_type:complete